VTVLLPPFINNFIKIKKGLSERSVPATTKLDEIKKELRGFTSLNGFSAVLNTSNPFVKSLWLFFFLFLFSGCIQNVFENFSDYYEYTVITKIEYVNEYPMTVPAVTLCLDIFRQDLSTTATLNKFLLNCSIGGFECDSNDFYSFETRTSYSNDIILCHVLNGGRNSIYLEMLKNFFWPGNNRVKDSKKFDFQQYGARPHAANSIKGYLKDKFNVKFIEKKGISIHVIIPLGLS